MTHEEMWHRLSTVVQSTPREEIMQILEEVMIGADVGVDLTERLLEGLHPKRHSWEEIRSELAVRIRAMLEEADHRETRRGDPHIVLLTGVNGSGKTTTAAKLAKRELSMGGHPLLVAADTFRPGAIDQLKIWGERLNVPVVAHQPGGDPAAVVYDAMSSARSREASAVIVDTAGRLHTKRPLMEELAKIIRVIQKSDTAAPQECLLVLDATTGQNGLVQAREFLDAIDVNGVVLTKLDGTAKGGIVLQIVHELHLPVDYVGVGEGMDDLVPFIPEDFTHALLSPE